MFLEDLTGLLRIVKEGRVGDYLLKLFKALAALCEEWCEIKVHGGSSRSRGSGSRPAPADSGAIRPPDKRSGRS